jgi:hypothetical protein
MQRGFDTPGFRLQLLQKCVGHQQYQHSKKGQYNAAHVLITASS